MLGRTLSHYLIESRLGEGGMGAVYLARDLALGRSAALKVVTNAVDADLRDRFFREAEASARLQHPAIATFYESSEADGQAFIAMEYVRGSTLRELLARGPLPVDTAIALTSALLEALNHAHAAGILHRDIKPENIIVTPDGAPKLLDFGLAKGLADAAGESDATVQNLTGGRILGTVGYMSPEQLRGEHLDAASDLFAVGAVLYEMVSGRPAFPGAHASERIAAILSKDPAPLTGPARSRPLRNGLVADHPAGAVERSTRAIPVGLGYAVRPSRDGGRRHSAAECRIAADARHPRLSQPLAPVRR